MIEIEKKFRLTDQQRESLVKDAEFVGEKTFTDTYYDTADYILTTKDIWLRRREDAFELKVAVHFGYDRPADQYDEITDEKAIREKLRIKADTGDLAQDLAAQGIVPFVACRTTRRKYRKDEFNIDLDLVRYQDDSTYTLAEIERMVTEQSEVPQAIEHIHALAQSHGCTFEPVRGKVVEYLMHQQPDHFRALITAGVIQDI